MDMVNNFKLAMCTKEASRKLQNALRFALEFCDVTT